MASITFSVSSVVRQATSMATLFAQHSLAKYAGIRQQVLGSIDQVPFPKGIPFCSNGFLAYCTCPSAYKPKVAGAAPAPPVLPANNDPALSKPRSILTYLSPVFFLSGRYPRELRWKGAVPSGPRKRAEQALCRALDVLAGLGTMAPSGRRGVPAPSGHLLPSVEAGVGCVLICGRIAGATRRHSSGS